MTARPYYPDICIDVDLSAEVAATPIRSITFLVGNLSSHGARLHLLDKVPPAAPCCRRHAPCAGAGLQPPRHAALSALLGRQHFSGPVLGICWQSVQCPVWKGGVRGARPVQTLQKLPHVWVSRLQSECMCHCLLIHLSQILFMLNRRLSISTLHLKSGCLSTKLIFDGMMGSFY